MFTFHQQLIADDVTDSAKKFCYSLLAKQTRDGRGTRKWTVQRSDSIKVKVFLDLGNSVEEFRYALLRGIHHVDVEQEEREVFSRRKVLHEGDLRCARFGNADV